jgi:carbonic anhydrase
VLNLIPFASLAAILLMVGYKLSKVQLYKQMYQLGYDQFIPFIATILGVLFQDLLKGIAIGMAFSVFYILRKNYRNNYTQKESKENDKTSIYIRLSEEVTFLNKGSILETLFKVPNNSFLTIDGSNCKAIDYDVLEIIQDFRLHHAKDHNIELKTINIPEVAVTGGH